MAGAGMHSALQVHKVDVTAAAKPAKQWGWEEKEAQGINTQLWSLLWLVLGTCKPGEPLGARRHKQLSESSSHPPCSGLPPPQGYN